MISYVRTPRNRVGWAAKVACVYTLLTFASGSNPANVGAAEMTPDQLAFRRQAVRRMIFDASQDIPLAGLWPAKVIGLDVMHPAVGEQVNHFTMDRSNFPGMPTPSWTYGAMYLYHGYPTGGEPINDAIRVPFAGD